MAQHTGLAALQHVVIFLDQGLNPHPLHWQVDSLPLDHQGHSLVPPNGQWHLKTMIYGISWWTSG